MDSHFVCGGRLGVSELATRGPATLSSISRAGRFQSRHPSNFQSELHFLPRRGPPEQITLLRRWIKEGAKWTDHWAFVAPKPQPLPAVKHADWVRQPLDRFILARLERESLPPSPEASKPELLRRVSLDLTGLPPTVEEQTAYMAD